MIPIQISAGTGNRCLLVVLMLMVGGLPAGAQENRANNAERPVARKISCLGRVTPGEKVLSVSGPYTLQGPSIVRELFVRRGDKVTKGQVLARLHNFEPAEAQLHQAEADVEVAARVLEQVQAGEKIGAISAQEAMVLRFDAEQRNADDLLRRKKDMVARKAISEDDFARYQLESSVTHENYRQATNQLAALKEIRNVDVRVAEARLASARAVVKRAQADLDQAVIRSPIDGTILEILTYPGEMADRNPLLQMGDLDHLQVQADVYVTDIANVRLQAHAVIRGDGFSGEVSGTVTEIGRQVDRSAIFDPDPASFSDRRVVKVWIKLEDPGKLQGLVNHQVNVVITP